MANDSIPARFFATARNRGGASAVHTRTAAGWQPLSWTDYAALVRRVGRALIALGVPFGQATCILGYNRLEWVAFAVGTMAAGGVPAGIYTTCSPSETQYIIEHAEASVVLVENREQYQKIAQERHRLPGLKHIVLMQGARVDGDPMALTWEEFLARGDATSEAALDERTRRIDEDDSAAYIYTSGTTGPPKAVMITHRNCVWTAEGIGRALDLRPDYCSLSYLPLSHIAEQVFTIHGPAVLGNAVYFAEALEKLRDNLLEVQPHVFFGVPRVWEKFHAALSARLSQATGVKARLLAWARGVARDVHARKNRGQQPSAVLALQYRLANKLIFGKLKPAIGFGRIKLCSSGAAPIAAEVLEFFASLDIVIHEVYGQSEDTGPTSTNLPGRTRFGSVGQPFPGVEVRLGEDGEILVRGNNVFKGYFKDKAATDATLVDGWLHSGDLGSFDADGYLHITGRKKEILITAGGKNIAPKNIEAALKNHPLIEEAVVIGDRRHFISALLALDAAATAKWLTDRGHSAAGPLHEHPEVLAELGRGVEQANGEFARVEQVRKFRVLPRSLTIDHGELTPTMKIKRRVVDKNWSDLIESMYAGGE
ncbi:MAG: AMP-binding protein [Myxococcales bacterium]|nr:AMP-binding protein [Myxococcales bacterium]